MLDWVVPIVVALIMGPIVVLLGKVRKENFNQHAEGRALIIAHGVKIDAVGSKVDIVCTKLDGHLGWHDGQNDAKLEYERRVAAGVVSDTATETARVLASKHKPQIKGAR